MALAVALGVTPNRLMMPDIDLLGVPAEVALTQNMQGRPSRLWEWAQGERHLPLPFEDSHSWFGGDRHPDLAFALENRPYLTSTPARAAATGPAPVGIRDLMLAVLAVMTAAAEDGRHLDDVALTVRRIVELLITFPEMVSPEEIRERFGSRPGAGDAGEESQ